MELIAHDPTQALTILGLGLLAFFLSLVARWISPQEGDLDHPESAAELPDGWRLDAGHDAGKSRVIDPVRSPRDPHAED